VLNVAARRSDPGRTIVEHAGQWPADIIVVDGDTRSRLHRAALGAVARARRPPRVVRRLGINAAALRRPPRLRNVRPIGPAPSAEGHA
jgi:hypothetical protein